MRLPHHPNPNPDGPRAASTSVVSVEVHSRVRTERHAPDRRLAFALDNSVVNGGSMVSDTAKAKFGQINEFYMYALFDVQTSRNPNISPKRTEEAQEKSRSDVEQTLPFS